MKAYHRTSAWQQILDSGFEDNTGHFGTRNTYTGVWLSDVPLDANEGAIGDGLLRVELPDDVFGKYEWVEEWRSFREALIPAGIVNEYPVVLVEVEPSSTASPRKPIGTQ